MTASIGELSPSADHESDESSSGVALSFAALRDSAQGATQGLQTAPSSPTDTLGTALRRLAETDATEASPTSAENTAGDDRTATPECDSESGSERRSQPRRDSTCRIQYVIAENDSLRGSDLEWKLHSTQCRGQLADISQVGIAIVIDEVVAPSSRLFMRLTNPRTGRTQSVEAFVLRCTPSDGAYRVVCRLKNRMTIRDVESFGSSRFTSRFV